MDYKRYIKRLLLITLTLFILVAGFNRLVNPYGVYDSPVIENINSSKPEFRDCLRLAKLYAIRHVEPETICLGTSRADTSIDPDHPGWAYKPVYNLALRGGDIYEVYRYFQTADAIQPLKQVVLVIDYFTFNAEQMRNADFKEGRLSSADNSKPFYLPDHVLALCSLDSLMSSVNTIIYQQDADKNLYMENGRRKNEYTPDPIRTRFNDNFKYYLLTKGYYSTILGNEFNYYYAGENSSTFDYYREILSVSYEKDISIIIATSPCHVTQWETLAIAGLWDRWEEWKSRIVEINEEEAKKADKIPFPIWDFSTYNYITEEEIPSIDDENAEMKWYWDASHYNKEVGDLILYRIFGMMVDGNDLPDNFGVLLTSENIEQHLQQVRQDRESYRKTHPDEVAGIQAIMDFLTGD